ncbi:MAG: MaoC family dehydratase [Chloroflexota bacterium]
MAGPQEINYHELQPGYEFPPATYRIDAATLEAFLRTVGEESGLYSNLEIVPPMAVTAFAMAALSESMSLPWGSIHVSQEMEFTGIVGTGDAITSSARVTRNHKRGGMHLLAIELKALDSSGGLVLAGRTTFVLPE